MILYLRITEENTGANERGTEKGLKREVVGVESVHQCLEEGKCGMY